MGFSFLGGIFPLRWRRNIFYWWYKLSAFFFILVLRHFSSGQQVLVAPQDQPGCPFSWTSLTCPMCNAQFVLTASAHLKHDPIKPNCDLWPTVSLSLPLILTLFSSGLELSCKVYRVCSWNYSQGQVNTLHSNGKVLKAFY